MPITRLGRPNYEKLFGNVLRGAVYGSGKQCEEIAKSVGTTRRTVSNRFVKPGQMTLHELKSYIRVTNIREEDILDYLYERNNK